MECQNPASEVANDRFIFVCSGNPFLTLTIRTANQCLVGKSTNYFSIQNQETCSQVLPSDPNLGLFK